MLRIPFSGVAICTFISPLVEDPWLRVRNCGFGLGSALKSWRSRGNLLPVLNPTSLLQKKMNKAGNL